MSEIPIGTPPAPPGRHAAPSGWYPDPAQEGQERYWDGWQWSRTTRPAGQATAPQRTGAPTAAAGPAQPAGYSAHPGLAPAPALDRSRTADGVPLAGWWSRVLSVLIDTLLVYLATIAVTFPIFRSAAAVMSAYFGEVVRAAQQGLQPPAQLSATDLMSTADQLAVSAAFVGIGFVYNLLCWQFRRATLGQLITGLRVVPAEQGHHVGRLGWRSAAVRSLVWTVPGLFSLLLVFQLVDLLYPLWHQRRQSLHDLAARTQVIRPH